MWFYKLKRGGFKVKYTDFKKEQNLLITGAMAVVMLVSPLLTGGATIAQATEDLCRIQKLWDV